MTVAYIKTKHFDKNSIGGSITHTKGIINGFHDCGEDIVVYTDIKLDGVRAKQKVIEKGRLHGNLIFNLVSARKYYRNVIREFDYNGTEFIYHRHVIMGDIGIRLKRKYGTPLVIEFNSSEQDKWNKSQLVGISPNMLKALGIKLFGAFARPYLSIWEPKLLKQADLIVVVSEPLKEKLLLMGIEEDRIVISPNGVDTNLFKNNESGRQRIREKHRITNEKTIVGFSGTFGTWHGIPELTDAILKVGSRNDLGYLLIGEGYYRNEMEKKLANISGVIFTGRIQFEEMPAYLSACDILVVSNSWNSNVSGKFFGSPTKLFEYMSVGKAIIASDLEQIGQILKHKETAFLFKAGNSEALAAALDEVISSPVLREKIGMKARETAIKRHTWAAVSRGIAEKFRCLKKRDDLL